MQWAFEKRDLLLLTGFLSKQNFPSISNFLCLWEWCLLSIWKKKIMFYNYGLFSHCIKRVVMQEVNIICVAHLSKQKWIKKLTLRFLKYFFIVDIFMATLIALVMDLIAFQEKKKYFLKHNPFSLENHCQWHHKAPSWTPLKNLSVHLTRWEQPISQVPASCTQPESWMPSNSLSCLCQ